MSKIKVAIVDDHKILRSGLVTTLSLFADIQIVFEACCGKELFQNLETNPVDVILLDIKMPEVDGYEVLKEIRKKDDNVKIIILTMYEEESFVHKFIDAKANSYLIKNSDPQEIYSAIKKCMRYSFYFNDFVKNVLLDKVVQKNKLVPTNIKPFYDFDPRELKVLKMLCEEKTSQQIADEIFVSVRTVDSIRGELLRKTKCKNTAGLVIYSYKNKLLE